MKWLVKREKLEKCKYQFKSGSGKKTKRDVEKGSLGIPERSEELYKINLCILGIVKIGLDQEIIKGCGVLLQTKMDDVPLFGKRIHFE